MIFRLPRARALVFACAAAGVSVSWACGDEKSEPSDDAGNAQEGDASRPADAGPDASSSPGGRDAGGANDAATPAADASGSGADAQAADASAPAGYGVKDQLAAICGGRSDYPAPLASGTTTLAAVQVGSTSFDFVEGALWLDALGELVFSDMKFAETADVGPPSTIHAMTPAGVVRDLIASAGSNGLALGPGGAILAATHDVQSLSLFDPQTKERTNIAVRSDGKRFNSPNDLVMRSDGTVFFTDPDWQLAGRTSETGITGVYRVGPNFGPAGPLAAQTLADDLDKPNGIALSPDERTLYVGSSGSDVYAYDVATDGALSNRRTFTSASGGSDGMTVDCAGNVYVVVPSQGVKIVSAAGSVLGQITTSSTPSNVAFGGSDHQTLFITATSHVYSARLSLPGLPY